MQIKYVGGVSIATILFKFNKEIEQLLKLNITLDEIVSDITYTILICKKDFDPKRGNFYKYLYTALGNNFRRKIYAINLKYKNEHSLEYAIPVKEKSHMEVALSEVPEIFDYVLGEIDDKEFIKVGGSQEILDTIEDYF